MNGSFRQYFSFSRCKLKRNLLAHVWICGLVLGAIVSYSADNFPASMMRAAACGSMSISGLLVVQLLPLLLSAYAVYDSQPVLLVSVVFLKAFLVAYTGAGILIFYPVSGWLIRGLLMFSDMLTLPLLWFIWLSADPDSRIPFVCRAAFSTVLALVIGSVDIILIAPFLARLI